MAMIAARLAAAAGDPAELICTVGNQAIEEIGSGAAPAENTSHFRRVLREDFGHMGSSEPPRR